MSNFFQKIGRRQLQYFSIFLRPSPKAKYKADFCQCLQFYHNLVLKNMSTTTQREYKSLSELKPKYLNKPGFQSSWNNSPVNKNYGILGIKIYKLIPIFYHLNTIFFIWFSSHRLCLAKHIFVSKSIFVQSHSKKHFYLNITSRIVRPLIPLNIFPLKSRSIELKKPSPFSMIKK